MQDYASRIKSVPRDLKLVWAAVFCLMFGFGIYSAVYYNFVTDAPLRISPDHLGWVESIRETPGFFCMVAAALTMTIAEPLLGAAALLVMAGGIAAYAGIGGVPSLILLSFIWSVGFHMWMPLQSSMVLNLAGERSKGKRLGQTGGLSALGSLLGMLVVLAIGKRLGYSTWFIMAGAAMGVAALTLLGVRRNIGSADKPRFVIKRKYSLYYGLTFLEGCRKQVFMTFAVFALTREYHTKLETIALLMVINSVVNMLGAPIVGRLIDRIGERRILTTSYSSLILVFLGYAMIHSAHVLFVLYCLDNFFYLSTTCLTTFVQKITDPDDLMPTLSVGVTFNHAAAVLVPLIGGYLWATYSYPVTFYGGAVVVAISLYLASKVGMRKVVEEYA